MNYGAFLDALRNGHESEVRFELARLRPLVYRYQSKSGSFAYLIGQPNPSPDSDEWIEYTP